MPNKKTIRINSVLLLCFAGLAAISFIFAFFTKHTPSTLLSPALAKAMTTGLPALFILDAVAGWLGMMQRQYENRVAMIVLGIVASILALNAAWSASVLPAKGMAEYLYLTFAVSVCVLTVLYVIQVVLFPKEV